MSTKTRRTGKGKSKAKGTARYSSAGPIAFFVSLFIVALGAIQLVSTFHTYALNLAELNGLKKQEASLIAQKQELENRIATVSATYGQDIVVLLAELGGKTPMARADDYFDDHGYGLGPERSGVLLLIAPGSRDWWISTRGTSITTFTDAGIQALGTRLKEPLGKSDWNGAATLFVQQCDRYMKAARAGSPITHAPLTARQKTLHWLGAGGGVLLGGVGPGWMIVQRVFVRRMRNEGLEPDARSYVTPGSLTITSRQDRFVTKYVTRTKRESSSSSSSSSDSSTHTSSSDATHGGGGGSF